MPIRVDLGQYRNVQELWGAGPNTIEVVTKSRKRYRVTALHNLWGTLAGRYVASFETQKAVAGEPDTVWVHTYMPSTYDDDLETCLRLALRMINDSE